MKFLFRILNLFFFLFYFFSAYSFSQDLESWATIKSQAVSGLIDSKTYRVGPGDEFVLGIWGEKNYVYNLPVSIEGEILIPEVGAISASGLYLERLRNIVKERVSQVFTNIDITFTLKRVRIFRVSIAGEIKNPGVYLASAMDRVSELVQQAGGLLNQASKRMIKIYRNNDTLYVDLAAFTILGKTEKNPFLQQGDVVFVPVLKDIISLYGQIYKNGDYEFIPGESLLDILPFSGGFKENALLDSIEIARFYSNGIKIEKKIINWSRDASKLFIEKDDRIMIRGNSKWHFKRGVIIEGEVNHPGYYPINREETNLSQMIQLAGGFTEEASLIEAKVIRSLEVSKSDPEFERLKNMNPSDMTEMEYAYFKDKSQEIHGAMAVDFEQLFIRGDLSQNIILQEGDKIIIPKFRDYIRITGQVVFAGNVKYEPELKIEDYIRLTGGYAWNARKNKLRVIRARTGEWLKKSSVEKLEPGDTIWVPEKPDRDWWLLFRQVMTVAAQGATLYLVVKTAID